MLEIKKLGSKNFFHYWVTPNKTFEYSASDLNLIYSNSKVFLRSINGAVIFEKAGYSINEIKVYDVGGSVEVFSNYEALQQRLIELGYTAYDISYIDVQAEVDAFQGEIDTKTDKGGYTGTAQDLKDAVDNAIFGDLKTYQTLADFNTVSPVPANGTPFIIANDTNEDNNGEWSVVSGAPIQNARTVENTVEETNTTKGVTGKAVFDGLEKKADVYLDTVNFFNPNDDDFVDGYFLNTAGNPVNANASYFTTGFIPVNEGDVIYTGDNGSYIPVRFVYGYDSDKVKIDGGEDPLRVFYTVPSGVEFIRTSTNVGLLYQINKGELKPYVPYTENKYIDNDLIKNNSLDGIKISENSLDGGKIINNSFDGLKILDNTITEDKTIFFNKSINIFNVNDEDVLLGYYVQSATGFLEVNASYNATGYIPVNELEYYTLSYKNQIAWFDEDKVYISGSPSSDSDLTQQAPANAEFLRCSVRVEFWDEFQVELGTTQSAYVPYGYKLKNEYQSEDELNVKQFESLLGDNGNKLTQATLTNGNILESTEFPYHIKKGISLSFSAKFSSFTNNIEFGKGFEQYRSAWLKIDNTNLSWLTHDGTTTTRDIIAHGLTLNTFVKCSLYIDDNSVAYVILQTLNGYFTATFQWGFEFNYNAFIKTTGQDLTDVILNATSKEFQHPVWAFGDSYFGVASNRWVGVMKKLGFFNFLINGLAGQSSSGAYSDFLRCLEFGTPKYLIWCLGMNDSDSAHLSVLNQVISKCANLEITLILATIPTVPTRDKETITANVIATGKRYIDFYNAVGANSSGVWYTGYLSADGVHPDPIGAEALAMQVLIDFPELMQYGLTSAISEVSLIKNDNVINNGSFDYYLSGWSTLGTNETNTITWENGSARFISVGDNISLRQAVLTTGENYLLTCDVSVTSGSIGIDSVTAGDTIPLIDGYNEISFTANSTMFSIKRISGNDDVLLDNVFVKEI